MAAYLIVCGTTAGADTAGDEPQSVLVQAKTAEEAAEAWADGFAWADSLDAELATNVWVEQE